MENETETAAAELAGATCTECGGTWYGNVPTDNKDYICEGCISKRLEAERRRAYSERRRAELQRRKQAIETPEGQLDAGIPAQYFGADFCDFGTLGEEVAEWYRDRKGVVLLYGPCGTGKTRMIFALQRRAYTDMLAVESWRATELVRELQACSMESIRAEQAFVNKLGTTGRIVVIDDLGAGKLSEFSVGGLGDIIDQRVTWDRPLCVATNLSPKQLSEQVSDRIASRLCDGLKLQFKGDDHRLTGGTK